MREGLTFRVSVVELERRRYPGGDDLVHAVAEVDALRDEGVRVEWWGDMPLADLIGRLSQMAMTAVPGMQRDSFRLRIARGHFPGVTG